jgi:hypothetical protein
MRMLLAASLFVLCLLAAYTNVLRSWGGGVFVYLGEERAPAAVRSLADYSELKGEALSATAERQLLAQAEIAKRPGFIGVNLGNPLLRMDDGTSGFSCRVRGRDGLYERLQMTFDGVGVSTSGDIPKMVVEAPCEALTSPTNLDTVWIPLGEMVAAAARDADYVYGDGDSAMRIQMVNIPGEWPPGWTLTGVRLLKRDSASLDFEGVKLRSARASMLSFEW